MVVVGVLVVSASTTAHAGSFDPTGNFSFDPSAVVIETFDDVTAQQGVTAIHAGDAIQGAAYVNVNTTQNAASFPLATPAQDASYVGHMFARTNRVVATVNVAYPSDGGAPSFGARFYPSGTVTSDGWYEVVTNPFSLQGSRSPEVSLVITASGADVDAFELDASGQFKALSTCSPPFDSACASNEFCGTGWCNDGNPFVPPLPPASERADVLAYFQSRMSNIFGGRYSRLNYLPNALATFDGLATAPDAWSFWNGIVTAIHRLHDWHTQVFGPVSINGQGLIPVCFDEGDADLTHAVAPKDPNYFDLLVTHVGPASTLVPGDRLVAVNGMHPFDFFNSLDTVYWGTWHADDPDAHAEAAEYMIPAIRRYATNITIIHCPTSSTCGAPQTIAVADLPYDDGNNTYPYCDHRPLYHLGTNGPNPVTHDSYDGPFYGVVTDSQPGENIYGMIWDDVYLDGTSANPYLPAYTAFQTGANAVILDHRLGNGGDVPGATYLTSLYRTSATIAAWPGFGLTLGEFDNYTNSFGLSLYSQALATGGGYQVGSSSANTALPVALMIARDGSASDWFPRGMTQGSPNIRLFGRHTAGAFSSYILFDYYSNFSWRFASGDLLNPDGTTNLGTGVQPDEEIVPLQSDLLAGVDTVYARALDWVRTCTTCRQ
jgi:hypothetical protein